MYRVPKALEVGTIDVNIDMINEPAVPFSRMKGLGFPL